MGTDVQALVIGGAAAGLSAALVLGRARVRTLVVDAGEPSNRSAPAIGGLLGQDGTSPAQLYAAGREQLTGLPTVEFREGVVTGVEPGGAFRATLEGGATVIACRVLIAGGMRYGVPDVPGLSKLWGDGAFMCPYCHGWEHRDQRIAILGGPAPRTAWRCCARGRASSSCWRTASRRRTWETSRSTSGRWRPWRRASSASDGGALEVDALHVVAPMAPRDGLVAGLGLETTDSPQGTGVAVADRFGATSARGAFAAGDAAGAGKVAGAIATGSLAATGLHRSLVFPEDR